MLAALIAAGLEAAAGPWPQGYTIAEDSSSPDRHYAVAIPEEPPEGDGEEIVNYVVDLKKHRILGKLSSSHYFQHANRGALDVQWSADSTRCVVDFEGRFGFVAISVVEVKDNSFIETDIGTDIQEAVDKVISKQVGAEGTNASTIAYSRHFPDRKVRVRAVATTNPKGLEDYKTYAALFQGTFDLKTKKWTVTDARPIDSKDYDALLTVYGPLHLEHNSFPTEQAKLNWLDGRLNEVYHSVRFILPPDRFSIVKAEEIAWLKRRDASKSIYEKSKLTEERIAALQSLLW